MKISYGFILLIIITIIACAGSSSDKNNSATESRIDAEKIYKLNCTICHGSDGKLGLNGSKDITVSPLSLSERITLITNGKGLMVPFANTLSKAEIKAVAKYTLKL